ncbi:MAG: cysteinyl-tRNA synthetase [Actinomycetia bacterium]|nr:cysteinyl-tRNA synthetase [Actinomycetes bacterium]
MEFYDTMARSKVTLTTRQPGRVSMYVCGPTVYDVPHLGHGRTAIVYDTIRRYLEWSGYTVNFVSNITDVDDKIIRRASEQGTTEPELASRYECAYFADLERLGVRPPDVVPHATGYIAPMIELIAELVASNHAYVVPGKGVYFAVDSYEHYGELSGRSRADLLEGAGARVDVDDEKRSPIDFALWKAAKPGEPAWESPWGEGRPGWHIECSAMALDLLGEGFDLHGGGDDLVFPHHENERAQAEGAGHPFARHWLHAGMLNVSGEKMSKSLGNFLNLSEVVDAHGPRALRLLTLQHHYRRQMEAGPDALASAAAALEGLDALDRSARAAGVEPADEADPEIVAAFRAAMDDDFNTPVALARIFEAVKRANVAIAAGDTTAAATMLATVHQLVAVLGIEAGATETDDAHDAADIDALVVLRTDARANRDFAAADRIRDELAARGVTLEDTPHGTIWHR